MGEIRKGAFGLGRVQIWLAGIWTLFVVGLASWWLMFSLRLVEKLSSVYPANAPEIERYKLMLISEGSILVLALVSGGGALLVYMIRERRALNSVREFFVTYTHDLKTALASLRLQTESLFEDLQDQPQKPLLLRLMQDTARLEVQLENSLLLADPKHKLWLKAVDLNRTVGSLQYQYIGKQILNELPEPLNVLVDERALEAVLKNVLHNSFSHGKSSQVNLRVGPKTATGKNNQEQQIVVEVQDNGLGFSGDRKHLAQAFVRHQPTSGSGIGLYLVRQLMERMGGDIEFPECKTGFLVRLIFQSGMDASSRHL